MREARARAGGVWRRARAAAGALLRRERGRLDGGGGEVGGRGGGVGAAAHLEPPLSAHGIALSRFFMYGNGTSSWSWWPCMKCFPIVTTPNTTTIGTNMYEYFFHCDVASARAPRERVAPLSTGGRGAGGRRRGEAGAGRAARTDGVLHRVPRHLAGRRERPREARDAEASGPKHRQLPQDDASFVSSHRARVP